MGRTALKATGGVSSINMRVKSVSFTG